MKLAADSATAPQAESTTPCNIEAKSEKNTVPKIDENSQDEGLKLSELQAHAGKAMESKQWSELLQVSRTPVEKIRLSDREVAKLWLLRIRVAGLTEGTLEPPAWDQLKRREELTDTLREIASIDPNFYKAREFWLYLECIGFDPCGVVEGFQQLQRACADLINLDLVRQMRNRGLRLLQRDVFFRCIDNEYEQWLLASITDVDVVLADVYERLGTDGQLDNWQQMELRVYQLELQSLTAEPWDYGHISDAIRRLPTPENAQLRHLSAYYTQQGDGVEMRTPEIWAFIWELSAVSAHGWVDLVRKYPQDLGCDWVNALALILRSFSMPADLADHLLAKAVDLLSKHIRKSLQHGSVGLAVTIEGTAGALWPHIPLRMPEASTLLVRLVENVPESYGRRAELLALCRIFNAASNFERLVGEQADEGMPGLAWLCQQSLSFAFEAANVLEHYASRINLLLVTLQRALKCGGQPPYVYFIGDSRKDEEPIKLGDGRRILENLSALAGVRSQFSERIEYMWLKIVGDLFQSLIHIPELRRGLYAVAQDLEVDLLKAKRDFLLGYLEQVEGDKEEALRHYLSHMALTQGPWGSTVDNLKLLWSKNGDLAEVQALVQALQNEHDRDLPHKATLAQLLTDAKAREAVLFKEQQFERTAVNRWPSLTQPARKLLGVLDSIQRYNGYKELGEYAGMSADWAERHYDKLIELGMVLVSDKGYRINPYIKPLLERESQHAVVGRIVRTQGTSAVKQVFNSQREFSIYQVMLQLCPNHLVFPNCSLQSIMSYEKLKELVSDDDFGYYLRASVDLVIVSSTTYLPMLAIEVDSVWHDTERQQKNDQKKDRIFGVSGIPFLRLRPVGSPSEDTVRVQVAEHFGELVRSLRTDLPGYEQAMGLLEDLSRRSTPPPPGV